MHFVPPPTEGPPRSIAAPPPVEPDRLNGGRPILSPIEGHSWESKVVLNPAGQLVEADRLEALLAGVGPGARPGGDAPPGRRRVRAALPGPGRRRAPHPHGAVLPRPRRPDADPGAGPPRRPPGALARVAVPQPGPGGPALHARRRHVLPVLHGLHRPDASGRRRPPGPDLPRDVHRPRPTGRSTAPSRASSTRSTTRTRRCCPSRSTAATSCSTARWRARGP